MEGQQEAISLARAEFASTHRPRFIVHQFQLARPLADHKLRVDFNLINIGDVEGVVRFLTAHVLLWNGRFFEAPGFERTVAPYGPRPLKNGQRVGVTAFSQVKITEGQLNAVEQGTLIVCVLGEITYTDPLGTERRTGFRRQYDVSSDLFVASDNEDHEYQH